MAQPVSNRWLDAISGNGPGALVAQAAVLSNGVIPPGYGVADLPVEQVQVTVDRTSEQRTTVSVLITWQAGAGIVPTNFSPALAPNGNELLLWTGFDYSPGRDGSDVELVQLGVFPIVTVTTTANASDTTIQVDADDRSYSISRRALLQPYTTDGETTTVDQAIAALINANSAGMPAYAQSIQPTGVVAPGATYDQGTDPFQASLDLADGCGFELFFDRSGNLQGLPMPDPGSAPTAWTYSTEGNGLPILTVERVLTQDQIWNDFFVSTANSTSATSSSVEDGSTVLQEEAADDDPLSQTYIHGPFGDIPSFVDSATATTAAAAQAQADLLLAQSLGSADTIDLEVVLNAAVDIDDIVSVTHLPAGIVNALYVVDGWTANFAVGQTMTLALRRVSY